MTIIVKGQIGYVEESTYALRDVPTEFRRFGNELGDFKLPTERVNPLIKMISSSFQPANLKYDDVEVEFPITFQLLDGKDISYFDDTITTTDNTAAGNPDYKHTAIPLVPSAAYTLQSVTVHIELLQEDGTFITALDVCGCLPKSIEIKHVADDPNGVTVTITYIGQRITDDAPTTNLLGATSGTTTDPESVQGQYYANSIKNASRGSAASDSGSDSLSFVFRTGTYYATNPDPFYINKGTSNAVNIGGTLQLSAATPATYGTVTSGGLDVTSYYKAFGIKIDITYKKSNPNRSGTNNYGANISPYAMNYLVESINVGCTIKLDTDDAVLSLQLDSFKKTKNKAIYIRVEKFHDSNDWIAFCFAPTSGNTENIQQELEGQYAFLADTDYYTLSYTCKDLTMIVGNDFSTLRSV